MKDTLKLGALGADTRHLQGLLIILGAKLKDDGIFGPATAEAVCDFQREYGLVEDGVVGPKTWAELQGRVNQKLLVDRTPTIIPGAVVYTEDDLHERGVHAIKKAVDYWAADIYDPRKDETSDNASLCKAIIGGYIREGLGWTWEPPYAGDGDFEWCGAFAAMCWSAVKPELRKTYFASTYRLDRYARYQAVNGEKNEGSGRLILELDESTTRKEFLASWQVRAGDILLIGPKGYGAHICLVESYDAKAGVFNTIEGNGTGAGPHGERQQGVVRARRFLGAHKRGNWCVRRLIRPSVEDLA